MNVPATKRLSRYLSVILRWLAIAIVVYVLTIFSCVFIIDHILHKVYTATAQMQLRPNGAGTIEPATLPAEFETMESPDVLLSVIKDLGLDKTWAKKVYKADSDQLPDVDALTRIQKMLRIDAARGTNIINITVSSDDPTEAARIANAIADKYKTMRDSQQDSAQRGSNESPVRIVSRAEPPAVPSKPNKAFDYIVALVVAGFLSITIASFVEIVLLFLRAGERNEN